MPDAEPAMVRQGVARLFKVQEDAVDRLFTGRPLRVKQGVDAESASRYRSAFRDVGALIQIVESGSPPPAARVPAQQATTAAGPASPSPNAAEEQQPPLAQVTEAGDFDLAEPGAIIDHTEPPPAVEIDTGSLEALPPNTGTLEDCRNEKPPRPIPDISHLRLVDD